MNPYDLYPDFSVTDQFGNLVINDIDTSAQRDPSIAWTSLGSLPHNQNIQATAATGTKIIIP